MRTAPQDRPPKAAPAGVYAPLDPLGGGDLPPGRLPHSGQGGEQAEPSRGEQASDDTDDAPASDAVSSQGDDCGDDLLEPDFDPPPGETGPF